MSEGISLFLACAGVAPLVVEHRQVTGLVYTHTSGFGGQERRTDNPDDEGYIITPVSRSSRSMKTKDKTAEKEPAKEAAMPMSLTDLFSSELDSIDE